jgi:glycosyltransferase involved in cell wall biosynthesis
MKTGLRIGLGIMFANDAQFLPTLLPTLLAHPNHYPIVLADVGKDEESKKLAQDFVQAYGPEAQYVDVTGRSKALNTIIEKLDVDYVLFMDPSIVFLNSDWIEILAHRIYSDDTIETVSPLQVNDKDQACYTGVLLSRCNPLDADRIMPASHKRVQKSRDFKMLNGSVLMVRKNDRRFDERYQLGYEDLDYTLRVYKDGKRNVYEPKAKVGLKRQYTRSPLITPKDAQVFMEKAGGLEILDSLNDAGEYYGSGPSFSAIENYFYKEPPEDGSTRKMVACFPADYDGCGLHRVINPYRALMLRGYNSTFTSWVIPEIVEKADVIVWQRAASDHILKTTLEARAAGKHVIYEIDDYFHGLHPGNPSTPFFVQDPEQLRRIEQIIHLSSALTVTTPELKRLYGRFNSNVHILPNYVDFGLLPWKDVDGGKVPDILLNDSEYVRIGWGGSNTHDADLMSCASAVEQIMQEFPMTKLVFMGWDYRHMFPSIPVERMEWLASTYGHEDCVGDYYKELNEARLDIGIAPIEDTTFNRAKSDIKILEYSIFGIASLASDVAPYTDFEKACRHPETGQKGVLLARSPRDWYKHLRRLVESKELREKLGAQAQAYVWRARSVHEHARQIEEIIKGFDAGKEHVPNNLPASYAELASAPELLDSVPVHSLNVSYIHNLTSRQAVARKAEWLRQQAQAEEKARKGLRVAA